jgi:ATP-binding cassette subfamily C protein CydD
VKPVDPRLLRLRAARGYLGGIVLAGTAGAVLVVVQAETLARVLVAAVGGRLDAVALTAFGCAVTVRGGLHLINGWLVTRTAARVKAQLRQQLLDASARRGPAWLVNQRTGELGTLIGRGVDALDAYLTGYLPTLVLSVTVPAAVVVRLFAADLESTLIVLGTLPLLPVFAILVGWYSKAQTDRQWRALRQLGGHFLDMVQGLPTLRAFGRAQAQVRVVRAMADKYRDATMRTLRSAFLSALVLELVATVSVALVAVPIGLRLLGGGMTLPVALLVLLLAPEAYAPLRAAGAKFHASQEGLSAAAEAFAVLDAPAPDAPRATTNGRIPDAHAGIEFDRVDIRYGDMIVLREASFAIAARQKVGLIGPSGSGKSSILAVLLGFVIPAAGTVRIGGADLSELDIDAWRARIAWVPQRAHPFAATVAANVSPSRPDDLDRINAAIAAAGAEPFVRALPAGIQTRIGAGGRGLSSGERQRIALARAFARTEADVLLLDEPTARLDGGTEADVLAAAQRLAQGRTALVVAHRPALLPMLDRVLLARDGGLTWVGDAAPTAALVSL